MGHRVGSTYVTVYSSSKDKVLGCFQSAIPHGSSHGPSDLVAPVQHMLLSFLQGRVPGSSNFRGVEIGYYKLIYVRTQAVSHRNG